LVVKERARSIARVGPIWWRYAVVFICFGDILSSFFRAFSSLFQLVSRSFLIDFRAVSFDFPERFQASDRSVEGVAVAPHEAPDFTFIHRPAVAVDHRAYADIDTDLDGIERRGPGEPLVGVEVNMPDLW